MPRYDPQTHVFSFAGTTNKGVREAGALMQFCNAMRRRFGASYRVVPVSDALTAGIIFEIYGATVDGMIETSHGLVALELLAYSPVGDRGDVMSRDLDLRTVLKPALYDALAAKPCSITLRYRRSPRPPPQTGMVYTVPTEKMFGALVPELRRLIAEMPSLGFNQLLTVRFLPERFLGMRNPHVREKSFSAAMFPTCTHAFDALTVQGISPGMTPEVGCNLGAGFTSLDEAWVRRKVQAKARKSLDHSRPRAGSLPLWLIVHSDGFALHQSIPETKRPMAVCTLRVSLGVHSHAFARAYWADGTGYRDVAWIGRAL